MTGGITMDGKATPRRCLGVGLSAVAAFLLILPLDAARADKVMRVGMTASDVPTTGGIPNNGGEGSRFLGYPVFDALVNWDFKHTDQTADVTRSEEHTSELQSRPHLVCRLLL